MKSTLEKEILHENDHNKQKQVSRTSPGPDEIRSAINMKKGEQMNTSEIFGLVVRCAGLGLALLGIHEVYRALVMVVQAFEGISFVPLLFGIPNLLLGIWFLRGATWLISFCYPQHQ